VVGAGGAGARASRSGESVKRADALKKKRRCEHQSETGDPLAAV
jgi:hypothetical protein